MTTPGQNPEELRRLLAAPPPAYTFPTEVILDLDGRELWRGVGPLCRTDLRGLDLRRADLRERNLRRARLAGADLRGACLECSDLSMADLTGADLRGADLDACTTECASFRDADLRDATGWQHGSSDTSETPMDLSGADLRGSLEKELEATPLLYDDRTRYSSRGLMDRRGKRHIDEWLGSSPYLMARSTALDVLRDRIGRVAWTRSKDSWHRHMRDPWRDEDLSGCDLAFEGHDHPARGLEDSRVDGCSFAGVELSWTTWIDVEARDADFRRAELGDSTFTDCNLRRSSFAGASLRREMIHCESAWENCDLRECDFRQADLRGADLRTSKLEGAQFEGSLYDFTTRFPPGFDAVARRLDDTGPSVLWLRGD